MDNCRIESSRIGKNDVSLVVDGKRPVRDENKQWAKSRKKNTQQNKSSDLDSDPFNWKLTRSPTSPSWTRIRPIIAPVGKADSVTMNSYSASSKRGSQSLTSRTVTLTVAVSFCTYQMGEHFRLRYSTTILNNESMDWNYRYAVGDPYD